MKQLIITPSARLSLALRVESALARRDAGETAWQSELILPWSQWVGQVLDEDILAGRLAMRPITPQQSLALWSEIVGEEISIGVTGIASLCMQAFSRMREFEVPATHEWDPSLTSVDVDRFARWAARYELELSEREMVDPADWAAGLPSLIRSGSLALPESVVFHGFVLGLSPLQCSVRDALADVGVAVDEVNPQGDTGSVHVVPAEDPDEEIELAAAWARQRLEAGDTRIGIVVTELSGRIDEVDRVMKRVLQPDHLREIRDEVRPWHIALGAPLSSFPVVSLALDVMRLPGDALPVSVFGSLLRSPFFVSEVGERSAAAALDARLRNLPGDTFSYSMLANLAEKVGFETAVERFSSWHEMRSAGEKSRVPAEWSRQFLAELSAMSFASGVALTSPEYQAWRSLLEVVDELSDIGNVLGTVSRGRALDMLVQFCNGRLFREKNVGSPIEVMSPKEAMGGQFDSLWVQGVDDNRWPAPAQPDPFLPRYLQQEFLEATAEGQHAQAEAVLNSLRRAAPLVMISYARRDGDLEYRLSDFAGGEVLEDLAPIQKGLPAFPAQVSLEDCGEDIQAPELDGEYARGGTGVLYDQASCPFRSFARHRLNAEAVRNPQNGLDSRRRGTLMHDALERFWTEVRGSADLAALDADALPVLADNCAREALDRLMERNPAALSEQALALEVVRLRDRVVEWAEMERQRPDFTVEAVETKRSVEVGGLTLSVKLDRIDRIETGLMPIDYKSGEPTPARWSTMGRLEDPQVPCYTLALEHPPAALAFGKLKPSNLGYAGISALNESIPGVQEMEKCSRGLFKHHAGWADLLEEWRRCVEGLAVEFRTGHAPVSPARASVCDYCDLKALCRFQHRLEMAA